MKILGPAAGRILRTSEQTTTATASSNADTLTFSASAISDHSTRCDPWTSPKGSRHIAVFCDAAPPNLSDGGRRSVARLKRDKQIVDLTLEGPPLQTSADVRECIRVAANVSDGSLKTLRLGPWGEDPCSCDVLVGNIDQGDAAVASLASTVNLWSQWSLRSVSIVDIQLQNSVDLLVVLSSLPSTVTSLKLTGLGLGSKGWLGDCVQSLGTGPPLQLDLSGNGLIDDDLILLLPMLGGDIHEDLLRGRSLISLNLSGNSKVTASGLRSLLSSISESPDRLQRLDLSECSLGFEGVQLLIDAIAEKRGLAALAELTLYRVGAGPESICKLIEVATRAPALRALNVLANCHHVQNWMAQVGERVSLTLRQVCALKVLTISCPENHLAAAKTVFEACSCRVILVPNERNNYNRPLFMGAD